MSETKAPYNVDATGQPSYQALQDTIERLEAENTKLKKELRHLKEFYEYRWDMFHDWGKTIPEPYQTQVYNILANGKPEL